MSETNADQRSFWTEQAGPIWVAQMQAMDAALAPVLDAVLDVAKIADGARVIDVGCGAGTSTLAIADRTGPKGHALGLDISQTLLAVARSRASDRAGLTFLEADAQIYPFEPDTADVILSRFGVMFFDDFDAAFANLRTALTSQGVLAMATWGDIASNPYFTMPAGVAKQVLEPVPRSDPDLPGPFALRDPVRISNVLGAAGFEQVEIDSREITLTPKGDCMAVADLLCEIGPAQRALAHHEASPDHQAALKEALAEALSAYETAHGIRIPALINIVTARKGA